MKIHFHIVGNGMCLESELVDLLQKLCLDAKQKRKTNFQ